MLFESSERVFTEAVANIGFANVFDAEAVESHETIANSVDLSDEVKNRMVPLRNVAWRKNFPELLQRAEAMAEVARDRVRAGQGNANERELYRDLALFVVYYRYRERLQKTLEETLQQSASATEGRGIRVTYYGEFVDDLRYYLDHASSAAVSPKMTGHWFASFFQIRRAFMSIHTQIFGNSRPIAQLRANVWQSIFTHDMRHYRDLLYHRMHDFATLITGPSGTGKDLVAAAIGLSRYVAFDAKAQQFEEDFGGAFHPVNLSALSPQLIESELFGHCKGAFTGAVKDRIGWLESCKRCHTVFLDEIGELAPAIQVKLLRVLQNRTFQRVGETTTRSFEGKVIAATNRDLDDEMRLSRFRRDFYYRLCSDRIRTPSLREQLKDNPNELHFFVEIIVHRLFGDAGHSLTKDVVAWIDQNLPRDFGWPGNIRELEQCVRNVVVRREYHPPQEQTRAPPDELTNQLKRLQLTADELLSWYCTLVFGETGSYSETARRLKLDRRTVQRRIDTNWLDRLPKPCD